MIAINSKRGWELRPASHIPIWGVRHMRKSFLLEGWGLLLAPFRAFVKPDDVVDYEMH